MKFKSGIWYSSILTVANVSVVWYKFIVLQKNSKLRICIVVSVYHIRSLQIKIFGGRLLIAHRADILKQEEYPSNIRYDIARPHVQNSRCPVPEGLGVPGPAWPDPYRGLRCQSLWGCFFVRESNPGPLTCGARALPLSYTPYRWNYALKLRIIVLVNLNCNNCINEMFNAQMILNVFKHNETVFDSI
jgi:hypothetical protein